VFFKNRKSVLGLNEGEWVFGGELATHKRTKGKWSEREERTTTSQRRCWEDGVGEEGGRKEEEREGNVG